MERALQLVRPGGTSALLTLRNWMFIKQFSSLREWLLKRYDLRMLGDVDRGAFDEVPNEILAGAMSIFQAARPSTSHSVAMQPTPLNDQSYDRERTARKRAAVRAQVGRHEFQQATIARLPETPLIYWWSAGDVQQYISSPKIGEVAPARQGLATADNARFLRAFWEESCDTPREWDRPDVGRHWQPFIKGGDGVCWIEPLRWLVRWRWCGLEMRTFERRGRPAAVIRNPDCYFKKGVAFTKIGVSLAARAHRYPSIFDTAGSSVFPTEQATAVCLLNSKRTESVLRSLNPTMNIQVGDVNRLPFTEDSRHAEIFARLVEAFDEEESRREPSPEFKHPGASPWRAAQEWAQREVDRASGERLSDYQAVHDEESASAHLSFSVGVALGRFSTQGNGILAATSATGLAHGILFVSDASDDDSLSGVECVPIRAVWERLGAAIDEKRTLKTYLLDRFFPDVHRRMYENRPIYFPLSSAKKSFVAFVSIHRWTASTLTDLLAEYLYPARKRLEGEQTDLRQARDGADKKAAKAAEKRFGEVGKLLDELIDFIANVEQCTGKGPPPPDNKTASREIDARYEPELDDGVMINAAALWTLLDPQWKDPKKWWKELANAEGKKDYDWSHLAKRYFPDRVDAKCKLDPSLAVAHGCFWKYHPAKAYQWELRLQDEIRPEFTLDEVGSDAARAEFEADHADEVETLVAKEHQRRIRKQAKAGQEVDDDPQGDLEVDAESEEGEELSA